MGLQASGDQPPQKHVAVVGTGLAGLTTAWLLHNDPKRRYTVSMFEAHHSISLDAASVTVKNGRTLREDVVDVPMRSFAPGFYSNLIRLYDFLGIRYFPQRFIFSFASMARSSGGNTPNGSNSYFVHTSNSHQVPPPRPKEMSHMQHLLELVFVLLAYTYWTIIVFAIPTHDNESLQTFLTRTFVPRRFADRYLLPLMSSVATCSHAEILAAPASDIVAYKRRSHNVPHLSLSQGVCEVSRSLAQNIPIHFSSQVVDVSQIASGRVKLTWQYRGHHSQASEGTSAAFDHVVLAVAPPVVASIFKPLRSSLARIPFTFVDSAVVRDDARAEQLRAAASLTQRSGAAQLIAFHSDSNYTAATHLTSAGVLVATRVADVEAERLMTWSPGKEILKTARFPRVLRTVESRAIVNDLMGCGPQQSSRQHRLNEKQWHNGDNNVWLVGSWCWDGMSLLEGCVDSALRTAEALGVEAPWSRQG